MKKTLHRLELEEVTINGFKSIEGLSLKLNTGLNILIGKNGSGKSNFLESLNDALSISGFRRASIKTAVLHFMADNGVKIRMELDKRSRIPEADSLDDDDVIEDFDSRIKTEIRIYRDEENIYDNIRNVLPSSVVSGVSSGSLSTILRRLDYDWLMPKYLTFQIPQTLDCIDIAGIITVSFDSDGDVSWSELNTLQLVEDTFLSLEAQTGYERENVSELNRKTIIKRLTIPEIVKESLRMYSPIADIRYGENINIYHEDKGLTIENIKLEFLINKTWLPWSQLSDSTKRIFYLITEILMHPSSLILLEEPELGVHPHQFGQIMEFIREAASKRQIIISTHSPIALNHLETDELDRILIAKYDRKRGTQIRHLSPSQKKKGKIYMDRIGQLSDFWMLSDLE